MDYEYRCFWEYPQSADKIEAIPLGVGIWKFADKSKGIESNAYIFSEFKTDLTEDQIRQAIRFATGNNL